MTEGFKYESSDLEAMLFADNYYNWIISIFEGYIDKRILEVGAGSGNFTEYLLKNNVEHITALEPSKNLAPDLLDKFSNNDKVAVNNCFLNEYDSPDGIGFDTIFYINVLEHVEDDIEEIKLAKTFLTDRGHMLIMVPAIPIIYGRLDKEFGHFRRYLKKHLIDKVLQANLDIVKIGYMDFIGIFPWWFVYKFLGVSTLSPSSVKLYDRYAIPLCRVLEKYIDIPIGKNLFLIAKNKK